MKREESEPGMLEVRKARGCGVGGVAEQRWGGRTGRCLGEEKRREDETVLKTNKQPQDPGTRRWWSGELYKRQRSGRWRILGAIFSPKDNL